MPDIIKLLPDSIANQIAAGEVVQRPSSVVKELLENAMDAGASSISLIFKQAGIGSLQVIDNGKGMSELDARMCWERHATSKITKANDLYKLNTFGFRGEALASIAAVAQVELKTKKEGDVLGTFIRIEASEVKEQRSVSASVGTSITVKNLFYNVPARRNFLKSQSVETKHIIEEFQRIALANPHIEMNLFNDSNDVHKLEAGKLGSRIVDLLGSRYQSKLIAVDEQTEIVNIKGYIGLPDIAKRTRGEQYFFANNRYIKEPYFFHAVVNAFEGLLEKDTYPFFVLFLDVDPSKIDVNVHPTKTEVKFEDGRSMYAIIKSVVQKALGSHLLTPEIDARPNLAQNIGFNQPEMRLQTSDISSFSGKKTLKQGYNPFGSETKLKKQTPWEKLYEPFRDDIEPIESTEELVQKKVNLEVNPIKIENPFQVANSFIVCRMDGELTLIHQRRAHTKVLYEKYLQNIQVGSGSNQQLLFPRTVHFTAHEFVLILDLLPDLNKSGFDISVFGKNSVIVNGTPTLLQKGNEEEIIRAILADYMNSNQLSIFGNDEKLAYSLAKSGAVKLGTTLDAIQIEGLLNDLVLCEQIGKSPSGKTIIVKLNSQHIQNLFE